jgi:hypothetical protein
MPGHHHLMNIAVIAVKPVVSTFVLYPKKNEYRASHTDSQAKQVGEREALVAYQVSPCNFEIA